MELNREDIDIIRHLDYPKAVNLSIGNFIIKRAFAKYPFNELIGEKLAKVFGLVCPHNLITEVDGQYYVLSENLNKLGEFKTASELGMPGKTYSLYDAWLFLAQNYPNSLELSFDLVKIYIYDVLFYHFDRNLNNWGIITNASGTKIVILDNEFILVNEKDINGSFYYFTKEQLRLYATLPKYNPLDYVEPTLPELEQSLILGELLDLELKPNIYRDFREFIKASSKEYQDLFIYYFNLLTPEFLKNILKEVETENNLEIPNKEDIIAIYQKNRDELSSIYHSIVKENKNGR